METAWNPQLVKLGEILAGSWRFGSQFRKDADNRPASGSTGSKFMSEDDDWPTADDAYARGFIYLTIGEDHLFSLSKLVNTAEPSLFGYAPLARSAVEAFARAWWIFDPGIDRATLLIRGVTERIYNLREEVNTLRKAKHEGADEKEKFLRDLEHRCAVAGIEIVNAGRLPTRFTVGGHKRPASTVLIEQLMKSAGFVEVAHIIYHFLSGASKGLWFAQGQQFSVIDPEAEKKLASGQVSLSDIRTPTMTALFAWKDVMGRLIGLFGWKEDLWRTWALEIDKVLVKFKV